MFVQDMQLFENKLFWSSSNGWLIEFVGGVIGFSSQFHHPYHHRLCHHQQHRYVCIWDEPTPKLVVALDLGVNISANCVLFVPAEYPASTSRLIIQKLDLNGQKVDSKALDQIKVRSRLAVHVFSMSLIIFLTTSPC